MINKIISIIIIGLIIVAVALNIQLRKQQEKYNDLVVELESERNKKPKEIVIHDTKVEYVYKDGKTVVVERVPEGYVKFDLEKYEKAIQEREQVQAKIDSLSQEKTTTITAMHRLLQQKQYDKALLNEYETRIKLLNNDIRSLKRKINIPSNVVSIQKRGWIFRVQTGIGWNGSLDGYVGVKYAFWNKYGLTVGTTSKQIGLGITRKIDFLPSIKNVDLLLMGGKSYKDSYGTVFVGLVTTL